MSAQPQRKFLITALGKNGDISKKPAGTNLLISRVWGSISEFVCPVLGQIVVEYIAGSDVCAADISNWVESRSLSCSVVNIETLPEFKIQQGHEYNKTKPIQTKKEPDQTSIASDTETKIDFIPVHASHSLVVVDDGSRFSVSRDTVCTLNDRSMLLHLPSPEYVIPNERSPVVFGTDNSVFTLDMKSQQLCPLDLRLLDMKQITPTSLRVTVNSNYTWCVVFAKNNNYAVLHSLNTSESTSICNGQAVIDAVSFHPHKPGLFAVAFKRPDKYSLAYFLALYQVSADKKGKNRLTPICYTTNVGLFDPDRMIDFNPVPETDLVWTKSGRFLSYFSKYKGIETDDVCGSVEYFDMSLQNRQQIYFSNEQLFSVAKQCIDSPECELPGLLFHELDLLDVGVTQYVATPYCTVSYNTCLEELRLFVADKVLANVGLELPDKNFLVWSLVGARWSCNREKLYVVFRGDSYLLSPKYLLVVMQ